MLETNVYDLTVTAAQEAADDGNVTICGEFIKYAWGLNPDMPLDLRAGILADAYTGEIVLFDKAAEQFDGVPKVKETFSSAAIKSAIMANNLKEISELG